MRPTAASDQADQMEAARLRQIADALDLGDLAIQHLQHVLPDFAQTHAGYDTYSNHGQQMQQDLRRWADQLEAQEHWRHSLVQRGGSILSSSGLRLLNLLLMLQPEYWDSYCHCILLPSDGSMTTEGLRGASEI